MKQNKSSKKLVAKILLFTICFSLFLTVSPMQAPNAQAWLSIPAALIGEGVATIRELILGIIMGAAKKAAVEMIMEEVGNMIGDSSESGEKYIKDWEDYIKTKPEEATKKYMNDYLSSITQGRDSSRYSNIDMNMDFARNYEGFGGMNEYQFALIQSARAAPNSGGSGNGEKYSETLKKMNDEITASDDESKPEITCTDEDRSDMFASGNFDAFWECTSGINYAPLAYAHLQSKYEETIELEEAKQNLKALATGYLPATRNGKVTTPADTIAAIQNKAATISMDVTANATTITEVIVSAVTSLVGELVDEGIGQGKEQNQREDANTEQRDDNNTQNEVQQSGPQSMFKSN